MQPAMPEAKPEITIGVLGQDGHGKTTLTTAIAQYLSRSGSHVVMGNEIVIAPGNCVEDRINPFLYETEVRRYRYVDCRRHIDVMKNLLLNWIPVQAAVLVVSAVDGVTAQTKDQVQLARTLGISAIVVFLNKCDLTNDAELLDIAEREVRQLLSKTGYAADAPVIRGVATAALQSLEAERFDIWTSTVQELLVTVDATFPTQQRVYEEPFLMSIEDVFTIPRRGTTVTGRVERGQLKIHGSVEIVGLRPSRTTIATDLEQFHKMCDLILGGDNAGILLRGIHRDDVQRGQVLAAPGTIQAHSRFRAELYLLNRQEGGSDSPNLSDPTYSFFIRTTDITGTLKLEEGSSPVRAGGIVRFTVELETAVAMEPGLRFTVRKSGYSLGIGVVTEILA
ncbi:MAG: hypothetical protein JWN14_314 [Chthonomonadales bacterium]|nr:hypothetical protein [Chthonomonadales bacterium]